MSHYVQKAVGGALGLLLVGAITTGCQPAADSSKSACVDRPSACGYADESNTGWTAPSGANGTAHRRPASLVRVDSKTGPSVRFPVGVKYRSDTNQVQIDCQSDQWGTWGAKAGSTITLAGYDFRVPVVSNNQDCTLVVENNRFGAGGDSFGLRMNRNHKATTIIQWNTFGLDETKSVRFMDEAIVAVGSGGFAAGIQDIRYNDISGAGTGIHTIDGTIEHNYIHGLVEEKDHHVNGYARFGTSTKRPLLIHHNTIFNPHGQTDAVALFQDAPGEHNVTVTDNFLGGGSYTFYGSSSGSAQNCANTTNMVVTGNRFLDDAGYAPVAHWCAKSAGAKWENNFFDHDGTPVRP